MEIINESDEDATWWNYNSNDTAKWVALREGDLSAHGGRVSYSPPNNATGQYYVKFTVEGGGGTYVPEPTTSGTLGGANVHRDGTITLRGSFGYEVVVGGPSREGQIEILDESDVDVTWWCFNSDDMAEEIPHKKGDLSAKGGRVSYSPPSNATGAYSVLITSLGGHATYRDWAPSQSAVLGRAKVRPGGTITFRGSCEYKVVVAGEGTGYQAG